MTDAPNYNDGKWHGWNGGDCPVHRESEIEAVYLMNDNAYSNMVFRNKASEKIWSAPFIFRVIKEHREPREWWAVGTHMMATKDEAEKRLAQLRVDHPELGFDKWEPVLVREVIA